MASEEDGTPLFFVVKEITDQLNEWINDRKRWFVHQIDRFTTDTVEAALDDLYRTASSSSQVVATAACHSHPLRS